MKNTFEELTLAPFNFLNPGIEESAKITLFLFIAQVFMLILTKSLNSIFLIVITITASILAQICDCLIRRKNISISYSVILQGLIIGMFIPAGYPSIIVLIITFITLLITKYAFGGYGQSWLNSSACAIIMLYLLGTSFFPNFLVTSSYLQTQNIAEALVQDGIIKEIVTDSSITSFLNDDIFKLLGISIPQGYVTILWDSGSMIPAFRFNILTLITTIVLLSFNYIKA